MGSAFSNNNWSLQKCGNIAVLSFNGTITCNNYNATLPKGYMPYAVLHTSIWLNDTSNNRYTGYVRISTAGKINFYFYKPYSTEAGECTTRSDLYPYSSICYCLA